MFEVAGGIVIGGIVLCGLFVFMGVVLWGGCRAYGEYRESQRQAELYELLTR
jgi:hypothetical protein